MSKSLPPLTWFRSFEAAARLLSTTAAAQEIGLTQSAVSQQIRALEARLGVVLFHRHARGLSLSDEGRTLLPQVEQALQSLVSATKRFDPGQAETTITVAASMSVIEWVLAPALPGFTALHPEVSIRFAGTIWPDEYAAPRADIEIRFGSDRQVGQDAVPLGPNRLVAVHAPGTPGLEHGPLIETLGTSVGWQAWQTATGHTPGQAPRFHVDAYGPALTLAAHGNGVALVSAIIAAHAVRAGQVVLADPGSVAAAEGYHFAVRRQAPETQAFAAWFHAHLNSLTQDFEGV